MGRRECIWDSHRFATTAAEVKSTLKDETKAPKYCKNKNHSKCAGEVINNRFSHQDRERITVELTRRRDSKHPPPHPVSCERRYRRSRPTICYAAFSGANPVRCKDSIR